MPLRSRFTAARTAAGVIALALLVTAPPASAFEPPELFVRTAAVDEGPAPGAWIPLASAPRVDFMSGWEIGYRIQPSGQPGELHSSALDVTGVPGGEQSPYHRNPPECVDRN